MVLRPGFATKYFNLAGIKKSPCVMTDEIDQGHNTYTAKT